MGDDIQLVAEEAGGEGETEEEQLVVLEEDEEVSAFGSRVQHLHL